MDRQVSTTDEGQAYWQQRHDYEVALERDAADYDDWQFVAEGSC